MTMTVMTMTGDDNDIDDYNNDDDDDELQAGQKQLQIKTSQNERTSQAKRIQDLERQVLNCTIIIIIKKTTIFATGFIA